MQADPKVIVALDFADPAQAMALVDRLDPAACALKVGKEMFVVAGPDPVRRMRRALGAGFKLVTPGIRLAGSAADDQSRIVTPEAAVARGADYLVIGRPITQAADPLEALARINKSLEAAA
jgi:orotidine-5'-phosphate decarboxylase